MEGVSSVLGSTGTGSAVKLGAHFMFRVQGRCLCPAAGQDVLAGVM